MILKKIILTNIKSYVYEEIDFSEGINCILGLNGSGKSTIIESIGLALFDFKGKNLSKMLRYNEAKGSIEVEFFASDNRLYRVVRTIRAKGGSNVKLVDVEYDNELYHTTSDVYAFIQKILKIPKTKEFSKLFEEVIAVGQGQYVSAFLETATKRKENFDRLFELDKYKETGQKIKELSDGISKTHIRALKDELIAINTSLEGLPIAESKKEKLEQEHNIKQAKLLKDKEELALVILKKEEQEAYKVKIEELGTLLALNKEKERHHLTQQTKIVEDLQASRKAMDVVDKTQMDYLRYERNAEEINQKEKEHRVLEAAREEYQRIQSLVASIQTLLSTYLESTQEKNKEKVKKQEEATALSQNLFLSQTKLEELEVKFKVESEQLNDQKVQLELHLQSLQNDDARYQSSLIKIESLHQQSKEFVIGLEERIKQNQEEVKKVLQATELLKKLEKEMSVLDTQYETNYKNSLQTVDGMCPFLNEKCKNINENSLTQYFESEMKHIKEKKSIFLEQIKAIRIDKSESTLLLEIQNDHLQLVHEQEKENKEQQYLQDLKKAFSKELEENDILKVIGEELNTRKKDLENEKQNLLDKQKRQSQSEGEILSKRLQIKNMQERQSALTQDLKELERQLDEILKNQNRKTLELNRLETEMATTKQILLKSDMIRSRLDELRNENTELEGQRKLYLSNVDKGREIQKHQSALTECSNAIRVLEKDSKHLEEKREDLVVKFSKKRLDEYSQSVQRLTQDVGANEAFIISLQDQIQDLHCQITKLQKIAEEKNRLNLELEQYNAIVDFLTISRSVFNGLPLKLSKRYRENISAMATDLYQKISLEAVRIHIEEDYEVKLIDLRIPDNIKVMEQLSGGEQMSVAIAIRLSMLKHLSKLDIYFLDEPTINLDIQRREQIRDVVSEISKSISQLFVISHDDTFDSITERIIHIEKNNNSSKIV